jgi:hypothetical protein
MLDLDHCLLQEVFCSSGGVLTKMAITCVAKKGIEFNI